MTHLFCVCCVIMFLTCCETKVSTFREQLLLLSFGSEVKASFYLSPSKNRPQLREQMVMQQVPAVMNTLRHTGDTFITDMKKS